MKITKRRLKKLIREEKARVLIEQDLEARRVDPIQETNAAYDLISDLVTDALYPGAHGESAGRERIQAWISALQSVIKDLETEMPPRDESEFITLRDPESGDPEVFESRSRRGSKA